MTDPGGVVRQFLTLLETGQAPAAVELLTEDFEWRNTSMPTLRGRRAKGILTDMQRRRIGFRAEIHNLAADGRIVLTDRTDYLTYGRWESAFRVHGSFHVADGQIAVWDDHFAPGKVVGASVKGLLGLLRR